MGHLHDNCSLKFSYFILKNTSLLHAEILIYLHAIYIYKTIYDMKFHNITSQ